MPGKRYRTMVRTAGGKRQRAGPRYHALRRSGLSKASSAKIIIAGRTHKRRVRMARKAARTRRRR